MSEELKPCPFCGGEAVICETNGLHGAYVFCKTCYSSTDGYQGINTRRKKAIEAWNRRVIDGQSKNN